MFLKAKSTEKGGDKGVRQILLGLNMMLVGAGRESKKISKTSAKPEVQR